MKIHCSKCGDPVSTEIPDDTIVRAWVECPNCTSVTVDGALAAIARAVVESRADDYRHVTVDPGALDLLAEAVR